MDAAGEPCRVRRSRAHLGVHAQPLGHARPLRPHRGGHGNPHGLGTVYGFTVAGDLRSAVGTVRGVTTQFGYLFGSLAGGVAIAVGGIGALAAVYSILFLAATLPYVCFRKPCRGVSAIAEA